MCVAYICSLTHTLHAFALHVCACECGCKGSSVNMFFLTQMACVYCMCVQYMHVCECV